MASGSFLICEMMAGCSLSPEVVPLRVSWIQGEKLLFYLALILAFSRPSPSMICGPQKSLISKSLQVSNVSGYFQVMTKETSFFGTELQGLEKKEATNLLKEAELEWSEERHPKRLKSSPC